MLTSWKSKAIGVTRILETWEDNGDTGTADLTSSTSPGVMISAGDIMIASPATLTSMPRFWHSCPKIAPTPEKSINRQYTHFSYRQIQVTLWFQDGDFSRYLGTGLVRANSNKFHWVVAATSTYPIQQGIHQLGTCYWWIQFPLSSLSHVSAVQEHCSHVFQQEEPLASG